MNASAWIMLIVGSGIIYGGLGYFIWVAARSKRHPHSLEKQTKE
ncbi:MetS family NSS transporter small subunit [Melghirimyces algeriensis]|uniref:MetS family NSS transporter small subunit n=1 Tax=Melghirimyces algeriensis TaxID=910412 RepID=A0A521ESU2_9BACL|nr:MetS family NSS transporter small subunit [Melghirimyces algeriensis]SMO87013.1 hypothetical protein SAMN06264849_110114 [Melghirimyces algeriensis]